MKWTVLIEKQTSGIDKVDLPMTNSAGRFEEARLQPRRKWFKR